LIRGAEGKGMISYRAVSIKDSVIVEIPAIFGDIIARIRIKRAGGIKANGLIYTGIGGAEDKPSNRGLICGTGNLWTAVIPTWTWLVRASILTIRNPVIIRVSYWGWGAPTVRSRTCFVRAPILTIGNPVLVRVAWRSGYLFLYRLARGI
jgi:hypothetical protein